MVTGWEGYADMLKQGQKLGVYEIIAPVGKGGMGEVYRARDSRLDRDVAIKILPQSIARDPDSLARFEREAKLLASLNHPNIATVHDYHNEDDIHFLVMELIGGKTLYQHLKENPISVEVTIDLFLQMARGLDVAHRSGIVHRDLKPDNIKITNSQLKVLDFGLAKDAAQPVSVHDPNSPTVAMSPAPGLVTQSGVVMGTPRYMSPEQSRGKDIDQRTDVWAFGCCLYEALSGTPPFDGETAADILGEVLQLDPDYSKIHKDTPKELKGLLQACLQKKPDDRPGTMAEIIEVLQRLHDSKHAVSGMSTPVKLAFAGVAVALLAVIA